MHPFYRQYFDKKPKEPPTSFRVKYASSTNELPGITALGTKSHQKAKEFNESKQKPYENIPKVMRETRAPAKKGASAAFPSAKKHFKLAEGWSNDFAVMESRCNEQRHRAQKEFFDKPVRHAAAARPGMTTTQQHFMRPMEVYHKITPVRSIQQSINLIRALKNEQKDAVFQSRPKSVNPGLSSDNYGTIPNLRSGPSRQVFLPIKQRLGSDRRAMARMESDKAYYKTQSQLLLKEAGGSQYSSWGHLEKNQNRSQGSLHSAGGA